MTSEALDSRYTLLIATHNGPANLARLQRFLTHQKAGFRVRLLEPGEREIDRYSRGIELVHTEYCSLCGDDDLLFVDAIRQLLTFLAAQPEYSASQGWHFGFSLGRDFEIHGITQRSPSLDADAPLDRLYQLFRKYEPLTHAIYRTDVLKTALRHAQEMSHAMFGELLSGAIPAALGKVARLPVLHYGSSGASPRGWDPVEFLVGSTEQLLLGYRAYRESLIRGGGLEPAPGEASASWRLLDLIHLRYVSARYRPALIESAITARRRGLDKGEALLALRSLQKPRQASRTISARTISGGGRTYRFPGEFDQALAELSYVGGVSGLAQHLSAYE
jgi:hypothetical protein